MSLRLKTLFKISFVFLVLTAALFLAQMNTRSLPINHEIGGKFNLQSTHKNIVGTQDFLGKVVLLSFGYTSCPDICPMVVSRMNQIFKTFQERLGDKAGDNVQLVFITVDSANDTVIRLKEYLGFFNPNMVGFSGSVAELKAVSAKYGVVAIQEDRVAEEVVRFTHSDFMYLLDQQGRVRRLYSTQDPLDMVEADIESLLNEQRDVWERSIAFFKRLK